MTWAAVVSYGALSVISSPLLRDTLLAPRIHEDGEDIGALGAADGHGDKRTKACEDGFDIREITEPGPQQPQASTQALTSFMTYLKPCTRIGISPGHQR